MKQPRVNLGLGLLLCAAMYGCPSTSKPAPVDPEATPEPKSAAQPQGRLVVLGFDGVDPRWLEKWANEGKLPALKKLMEAQGGKAYSRLRSTNPPQSPVAWTSFATGTRPGDHGIFDFIGRTLRPGPMPVMPSVATTSFTPQPSGPPVAKNLRSGEPFWQTLGNQGVRVVALNVPYSFPPDPMRDGRMLSGLGVPDLRETNSTFTYAGTEVTDAQVKSPPGGGAMAKLAMKDGVGRFELEGPTGTGGKRMTLPVEVRTAPTGGGLLVRVDGHDVPLALREASPFVEVTFKDDAHEVRGAVRLIALESSPRVRLFVTPTSIHPRAPYSPITYPNPFAAQLADELGGLYKTVGWDHDTSALNAEVLDEALFLADMDAIETQRRQMLMTRLSNDDWDLLLWVSTATDRVGHMFYRLIDPEHPTYNAEEAKQFGNAIENEYRRMDATVAQVLAKLKPNDTLLIMSDHGFHGYRRGLHVNQWLREQGLLTLRNEATSGREFLLDVDWSQTKAYALGTGQIYLNLRGRESAGTVSRDDAPAIEDQIRNGLLALRDTEKADATVVRAVYRGREVFAGGRNADAPDLQVAFAENYRTSWETILGGVPAGLFADNPKKWSGDHAASDVEETSGILVSNRAITATTPDLVDFAPTALRFFGKSVPAAYVGHDLLQPR